MCNCSRRYFLARKEWLCGLGYGRGRKPKVSRAKLSPNARCSDAATLSIRDAAIPLLPRVAAAGKIIRLAYTGSSAARCKPPAGDPAPLGQPSNALGRENPPPFSHRSVWQGPARKQAWPSARAPHRAPTLHLVARACTCNGAPQRAPRAPPRHTSTAHLEGAAPQSSTGNDGLQLVEGR